MAGHQGQRQMFGFEFSAAEFSYDEYSQTQGVCTKRQATDDDY